MIKWMITSSALIVLVLVLRALVKGRAGARLRYALWLLAAVRLLLPGTLFESAFSVLNAARTSETYQLAESLPSRMSLYEDGRVRSVAGSSDSFKMEPGGENLHSGSGWTATADPAEAEDMRMFGYRAVDTRMLKRLVDLKSAAMWVWQIGVWAAGTFLLTVNLRFWLKLAKTRRPAGSCRGRRVYVAAGLASPCLFGLFRPAIYLTPGLNETEKEHVLAHEYTHFRHGDHAWAVWRGVCLALHWYNPLVWLAAYLSRRDCELACDEGAVKLLGEERRADYGRTLVGLVAGRTGPADLVRCATTMTGGKSAVKERIALLVKRPRTTAVMAVLVALACALSAACAFTGAKKLPETPEEMTTIGQRSQGVTASTNLNEVTAERVFEEDPEDMARLLLSTWFESIERYEAEPRDALRDSYLLSVEIREERRDYDTHDVQASFSVKYAVRPASDIYTTWWAGNGGAPTEEEKEAYPHLASGDGWIVKYGQGYVVRDGKTGLWSIPEMGTGGYALHYLNLDDSLHSWIWTMPCPPAEELPAAVGAENDFWQLLSELPGSGVALYRRSWDTEHVYLRYGEHFQVLEHSLEGLDMLPLLEYVDDSTIAIHFRRHEGVYFNGETTEPGVVSDVLHCVWNGTYWETWQVGSQPPQTAGPDLQGSVRLLSELPEDSVAAYLDQSTGRCFLQYGDSLQWVEEPLDGQWPPELYFEDLDGDGEKELAVIYCTGFSTGAAIFELTVYEWDGQLWTGTQYDLEVQKNLFNRDRSYLFDGETGRAEIRYQDSSATLDLSQFWEEGYWLAAPEYCGITDLMTSFAYQSGSFLLTYGGEIISTGSGHLHGCVFTYTCPVYYDGQGFLTGAGWLESDYMWSPPVDESLLTPAFRRILRNFIAECQANGTEDISGEYFAVCDINGDGENELITQRNNTAMAGQVERIYDRSGNELFSAFPDITYYDNGVVLAGWSHNQGWAGDRLWPYTLYRWDGAGYEEIASVDGFDKSLREGAGEERFPDELDKDGDGYLYYIIIEPGGYAPDYGTPMDNADYEAWLSSYTSGAAALEIPYMPLTEENIAVIG